MPRLIGNARVDADITFAERKANKLAALATTRWSSTQAMTYDGEAGVPADSAMSAVTGVVVGAQLFPPTEPFTWKLKDGVFRQWAIADVVAYGVAIRTHVQACFDREAELAEAINAASTQATLDAINITTGWPA